MVYLDSSSLLKLLWTEPESAAVRERVAGESLVIVSSLAELETESRLTAAWLAGRYRAGRWQRYRRTLARFRHFEPFHFQSLPGTVFQTALQQHATSGRVHCRTLDRLHLAAMAELGASRLITNDTVQADAAVALGWEVLIPR